MARKLCIAISLVLLSGTAVAQVPLEPYDSSQAGQPPPPRPGILVDPLDGVNLLVNGSFETNGGVGSSTFTGWTVFDVPGSIGGVPSGAGSWVVQTGATAPISGAPVEAPTDGTFAAMADSVGPSAKVIFQDFLVPPGGAEVSCDIYVNNQAGVFIDGGSLDWEAVANQQARVDIMDPAAPEDDVGAGVLLNLFITNPGDPPVQSYQTIVADLTPFAGQTVRLRFAEVDNQFFFNFGADNCVAIELVPPPDNIDIPTLGTLGLAALIVLLGGLGIRGLRRRR